MRVNCLDPGPVKDRSQVVKSVQLLQLLEVTNDLEKFL